MDNNFDIIKLFLDILIILKVTERSLLVTRKIRLFFNCNFKVDVLYFVPILHVTVESMKLK